MNEDNIMLGAEVRRRRKAAGLSLAAVAQQMGITAAGLSLLELGTSTWSLPRIVAVAKVLGADPSELVSEAAA